MIKDYTRYWADCSKCGQQFLPAAARTHGQRLGDFDSVEELAMALEEADWRRDGSDCYCPKCVAGEL